MTLAAKKGLYDNNVDMFWQKKAWVDKEVMMKIATKFVDRKNEKHGEDVWVLLFCDNLGAHVHDDVRRIFGDNKVFLCYFPPGMTNFIQPIDAGLGRSVRISVGNFLDEWLMIGENMERWESKWTAAERRIMISKWVGNAMQFVMQADNDSARIGAFERTGCLLTWLPNEYQLVSFPFQPSHLLKSMFLRMFYLHLRMKKMPHWEKR